MATRENTKQPASNSSSRDVSSSRDSFKSDKNASSSVRSTGSSTNAKKGTQNLNTSRKSGSSMSMDEDDEF